MSSEEPREKYRRDEVMIRQVRGLTRISNDLMSLFREGIREQLSDAVAGNEAAPKKLEEFLERHAAAVLIMPVLRAFATELTLKAIASKRRGEHAHEHDLLKLYDDLPAEIRQETERKGASQRLPPIRDTITKHKGDFVNWRYVAERGSAKTNVEPSDKDLDKALAVLLTIYEMA